ncbi:MAG: L-2-hydroxyglutarate oxidase [Proteobacteria bacterium]|nr:L-2-hydroxyglutarate oxidase [Pseudomonadota bacterium]HQR04683.1 L-2-hydroxyglutarate oxidase [Rhodocyclaceae bacterium]
MSRNSYDFVILGAGVVGMTIAQEIKKRFPGQSVLVIEKESAPGKHSSGRNSGVLHSGIYYPPNTLKARLCNQGAAEMARYCRDRKLPLSNLGKILVTTRSEDTTQFETLVQRAAVNGIEVSRLDEKQLKAMEPEARSATGEALFVPQTSVVDPLAVLSSIVADALDAGVEIRYGHSIGEVDVARKELRGPGFTVKFGHVVNAAGLHADKVAHSFGVGKCYTLLPFKGIYWKLRQDSDIKVRHLVYPVPDLRVPFLGVHTTTSISGDTYLGPTAVPAFGRENYAGLQDVTAAELMRIGGLLTQQFLYGRDGFRRLAWQEGRRYFKPWFAQAARAILPRLRPADLIPTGKVGIRAQMLDRVSGRLVNDFLVESGEASTHVLNAISPAFTSSFPFARFIVDTYLS